MSTRLSFIIPVLNEASCIGPLLQQLRDDFPEADTIVVDGGSVDDTVAVAMPLCSQLLLSTPGRAAQMNLGGRAAGGDYLVFLHADSRPCFNSAILQAQLADAPAWGFCPVRMPGEGAALRLVAQAMNWRSRLTRVATGDQMLFLRSDVFAASGGFDAIPLMEDVAYSKRLRRLGPPRILRQPVAVSSRRWHRHGVLRTVLLMWWLRLAYFCGASPQWLWRQYYGH